MERMLSRVKSARSEMSVVMRTGGPEGADEGRAAERGVRVDTGP